MQAAETVEPGERQYRMCARCVMDTTDSKIIFDNQGVCNHCRYVDEQVKYYWFPDERGELLLRKMIDKVKQFGDGKPYDSIIGLSGGVDSSYLAVKVGEWGLRPLAVHVDAGWNSELAVKNIDQIVTKVGLDLHTHVVDWEEMRDLQLAFLRSNLANQDVPQDHAFFAALYNYAVKNGIKYVISGSNYATESILPTSWGYDAMDARHLKSIHRIYGSRRIKTFPLVGFLKYHVYYPEIRKMVVLNPLNYIRYSKGEAIDYLEKRYGWRYYGAKHYESRWTRFFQAYYLPTKFGYDKRKAHLSSLIVAGEITRDQALKELEKPLYTENELAELEDLVAQPPRHYTEFPNNEARFRRFAVARSYVLNKLCSS